MRDPKVDPAVDDEFQKTVRGNQLASHYRVIEKSLSGLGIFLECCDGPYRGCCTRKHRDSFRKWAATAEVIKRGDE